LLPRDVLLISWNPAASARLRLLQIWDGLFLNAGQMFMISPGTVLFPGAPEEGFYKYALNSSNAELDEVIQELERELLNQLKSLYPARKLRNRDDSMRGL
jgi:hypothetical protein